MKHPNGKHVFGKGVDNRTSSAKRAKQLIRTFTRELGGADRLNCGELEIIKRLASLTVLVEKQEALLVTNDPQYNPDIYLRTVGNIRRIVEAMDLPKRSRRNPDGDDYDPDDTLEAYLARVAKEDERKRRKRKRQRL